MKHKDSSIPALVNLLPCRLRRMLLTGCLLLLIVPAFAGGEPRHSGMPGFTYSISRIFDHAVSGSGQDILQVNLSPVPSPAELIKFTINGSSYSYKTDASGNATLYFSEPPGTYNVVITDGAIPVGNIDMHFLATADIPSVANSYISVTQNPALDDGVAQDIVGGFIYDQYGNAVSDGTPVTFTIQTGTATMTTTGVTTNGVVYAYFTSTVAGNVTVQATVNGGQVVLEQGTGKTNVAIKFTAGAPDITKSQITVTQNPAIANGTAQDIVKGTIKDASGSPVADGTPVTFTIQSGTATMTTTGTTIGGVVYAYLTSGVIGSVVVQATVNGGQIVPDGGGNPNVSIQFVAGPPDVTKSYIKVIQNPATADGSAQDIVEAVINDASGRPVADNTPVTFTIQSGTATMTTTGLTAGGVVFARFTSTAVGNVVVGATVNGGQTVPDQSGNPNVSIQFIAGAPDVTKSHIAVIQNPAVADGSSKDIVQAVIKDANGHPVADGTVVTFTIQSGTATMTTTGVTSGGVVNANFTSTVVGSVTVQATVNGSQVVPDAGGNPNVSVQFTVGPPDVTKSYIKVTQNPATADGSAQDIVEAVINDASGRPVADNTPVTFTIQSGTATMTTTGLTAGGVVFARFTSTVVGNVVVGATVNGGQTVPDQSGNPSVSIQFVAGAPDVTKSHIAVIQNPAVANGSAQDIVQAVIKDANGHPVADGTGVTFTIQSGTATMTTTGVTVGGIVNANFTSTVVGSVTVQATVNGGQVVPDAGGNPNVSIQFTVGPPDVSKSYIVVTQNPATADGSAQDIVKAVINDASGRPVADGTQVVFTVQSGTATMTTTGLTVGGSVFAYFTSNVVGNVAVQATVNGGQVVPEQATGKPNVNIQFIAGPPDVTKSHIVVTQNPAAANGRAQDIVEAIINDASGRPVADGTLVTFTIQSGTATMTTTGITSGGVVYAYFTSFVPGTVKVQATANGGQVVPDGGGNPNVSIQFNIAVPDVSKSYITVTQNPATADGVAQDIVQAVINDASGSPVADGTPVVFTIQSGTATMTTTGKTSGGMVYAYFTSTVVGAVTVQATVNGGQIVPAKTTGNPNVSIQFTATAPAANKSYIKVTQDPALDNGVAQDIVEAVINDASGKPVADGTPVTFTIQSGTATITTTGVTTGGVAFAYFTSTVVGTVTVGATVNIGQTVSDQSGNPNVKIHFIAGAPDISKSYIKVTQNPATADGSAQDIVQAVINDASGNPVVDGTAVIFTIQSGTATMTTTGATVGGMVYAYFTSTVVGSVKVQATVNGGQIVPEKTTGNPNVSIQFIAAAPDASKSYIKVTQDPALDNGVAQDIVEAVINDASGKPVVDGTPVTFTTQSGSATMTTTGVTSGGVVFAYFTSTVVGTVTVGATVNISQVVAEQTTGKPSVNIHFIAGAPDISKSYITVTQNPAKNDGVAQDIVKAVISDASGQPVADNTVVTFTIQSGTATMTTTGLTVGGVVYAYFTSKVVGTVKVQATVNGGQVVPEKTTGNPNVSIQFTASAPDASKSYIKVTQDPAADDGFAQDIVEAVINDGSGSPVADGTVVTFTIQSGTATITTTGLTVGGVVNAYFTSTIVGTVTVGATINISQTVPDQLGNPNVKIHFIPGAANPGKSYITVIQNPAKDDGLSQDIVEAVINDASGQPVADNTVVTFTIQSGTATITTTGLTVGGVVNAYFTSTVVGTVTVGATININQTVPEKTTGNSSVKIQFVAGLPDPSKSYITVTQSPAKDDGVAQDIVQAVINDANGFPVADNTVVTFTIQSGTATMTTTGLTVGGVVNAYFTSTTVGTVIVGATINTNQTVPEKTTGNSSVNIQFVAGTASAAKSYIKVTQNPATADGVAQDIVEAVINDANGFPVPDNTPVTFTIQSGTATLTTTGKTVGGVVFANFTSLVVGTVTVQATVNNGQVVSEQGTGNPTVSIQFNVGPAVPGNPSGGGPVGGSGNTSGYTLLFIVHDFHLADGTDRDSVEVYVTDAQKHPVPGVSVTFGIQSSPTSGTATSGAQLVGSPTVTTGPNGLAGMAITSTVPGTVFIKTAITTATLNNVSIDGSYQVITFDTSPDVNNPLTALTTIIYEALADGSSQTEVRAHVVDLNGQIMEGQNITFSIDSGSAQIVGSPTVQTDANGDAFIFITSKTPGYALITATVDGKKIVFGSPARVKFASINIYVPKVFTPNNDGINDVLKPILVGISNFHYFSVYNRWGNLIYTTQDPNRGWDGTFKGVAQPVETYLWMAEGIDVDGKRVVQKGMVSLVR